MTKALLDHLRSRGTIITSTAPQTSQQNAHVERRFGSLFASIRASLKESGIPKSLWSSACLDAIDKANYLPLRRHEGHFKSPVSILPKQSYNPEGFLPFDLKATSSTTHRTRESPQTGPSAQDIYETQQTTSIVSSSRLPERRGWYDTRSSSHCRNKE